MPRPDGPDAASWVPAPQDPPYRDTSASIPLIPDSDSWDPADGTAGEPGTEDPAGGTAGATGTRDPAFGRMTSGDGRMTGPDLTTQGNGRMPDRMTFHQQMTTTKQNVFEKLVDASKPRTLSPLESLSETLPVDRLMGWVVTCVITALAFFIRWYHLGTPTTIMFDETYYAKDAWSLLQYGYEGTWGDGDVANPKVAVGDFSTLTSKPSWPSHPEVGKWLIAAGEKMFGLNAFGWRFAALVFGALLVFLTIRLARRVSRSTLIGGVAGLLLTVDGIGFVMSRIALLDIFQAVFILAGVSCVLADRDFFRNQLARYIYGLPGQSLNGSPGPILFRPWLLVAGVMFGLACGTKWNSIYPLAVFGVLIVVWSVTARRLAGAKKHVLWTLLADGIPAFISMVVLAVATYLVTWIPWLRTFPGHDPGWGTPAVADNWASHVFGQPLGLLWDWHVATYKFHTGTGMEQATHTYASNPWGWPVMIRTTGIYADNGIQPGDQGCTAAAGDTCLRVITAIGTPLLWWAGAIALLIGLVWWLAGMDWRFGVAILGMASTWLPWAFSSRGAMFTFYTITMVPFVCIGLAMALGVILGPSRAGPRRQSGAIIVGVFLALVILDFAFMYPLYTGDMLTRREWQFRIWLPGWI